MKTTKRLLTTKILLATNILVSVALFATAFLWVIAQSRTLNPNGEPPILIRTVAGESIEGRLDAVFLDRKSPVHNIGLGSSFSSLRWLPDHTGILSYSGKERNLVYSHFNPDSVLIDPPHPIGSFFQTLGINYKLDYKLFDISPDGSQIVGTTDNSTKTTYVINLKSGKKHSLLSKKEAFFRDDIVHLYWSRKGNWIVFDAEAVDAEGKVKMNRSGVESAYEVWMIHPDGTGLKKVANGQTANFSSDGIRLLYRQDVYDGLTIYDTQTGKKLSLLKNRISFISDAVISPDGKTVVFLGTLWPDLIGKTRGISGKKNSREKFGCFKIDIASEKISPLSDEMIEDKSWLVRSLELW